MNNVTVRLNQETILLKMAKKIFSDFFMENKKIIHLTKDLIIR